MLPDPTAAIVVPTATSESNAGRARRSMLRCLRGAPVTVGLLIVLLVLAVAAGPLAAALGGPTTLSWGVSSLHDGTWWTAVTSAAVLGRPDVVVVVGILLTAALGWYEHSAGSLRAVVAVLVTHLAGVVLPVLVVAAVSGSSWPWAAAVSAERSSGLTTAVFGVVAVGSALLPSAWRLRVRILVGAVLVMLLLRSGRLEDLEHLAAFGAGLVAGPLLAGRRPARPARFTVLRARSVVSLVVIGIGIAGVVHAVAPGLGGIFGGMPHAMSGRGSLMVVLQLVVAALLADSLRRGRAAAWWLTAVAATTVLVNALVNTRGDVRSAEVVASVAVLALLVTFRRAWRWRTPDGFARRSLVRISSAVAGFVVVVGAATWLLRDHFRPVPDLLDVARHTLARLTFSPGPLAGGDPLARTATTVIALLWAVVLAGLLIGWLYADRGPDRGRDGVIGTLVRRHGGGSIGWLRTWPGFSTWRSRDERVAIGYTVAGSVAIALGDPVGPTDRWPAAVAEFRTFCRYAGWTPCWFAATDALVQSAASSGWRSVQIGEDTVLELSELHFKGKQWQDVRTARNRAQRDGIRLVAGRLADLDPVLTEQVTAISSAWVAEKPLPEMGFTLGTVSHALDDEVRTHLAVDAAGTVQGVTTWLPVHEDGEVVGWTLDVMRRRPDGFRPVIEYLVAESALLFQAQGYRTLSLSVAPLARRDRDAGTSRAGTDAARPAGRTIDRGLDRLSRLLEPTYGFRSLLDFKAKFHPEFRPVHLVYQRTADLAAIGWGIGHAYLPDLTAVQTLRLGRTLVSRTR
ncbi:bifunctional lysylphosphatidylglycerol flippase/synthetase MprF [Nakamurella leprariae]|uniref:DUF2156 domain-containing protein n=1 Tax=Nakamurella leprariae TaxID=2803911 RepID=A0A938YDN9_9ACTN|nr:DUF2156 domain-containing protein [Nakamurella leprariae]MBM9465950.1 DUF2156 domain-containing protein [Nakamurella leprariae]